jgi:hypothetical protein
LHCWPKRQIWLCTEGHCAKFCYALWATVDNLVMCYGQVCRT